MKPVVITEEMASILAAISAACYSNTKETRQANRIDRDHPLWTAAYQDVCNSVDREMRERQRAEQTEHLLNLCREQSKRDEELIAELERKVQQLRELNRQAYNRGLDTAIEIVKDSESWMETSAHQTILCALENSKQT